jgi:carbon storage regulator CsrA
MGNLVLSRRIGESIRLGHDCVVTVSRIQGNEVRLCFDCPASVPIVRTEVLSRPQKKKDEQDDQDLA